MGALRLRLLGFSLLLLLLLDRTRRDVQNIAHLGGGGKMGAVGRPIGGQERGGSSRTQQHGQDPGMGASSSATAPPAPLRGTAHSLPVPPNPPSPPP